MKNCNHIFFDLDRTLWDFDTNSGEVLTEIFVQYKLHERGINDKDKFIETYQRHNTKLWSDYSKNLVNKASLRIVRFQHTLKDFNINDDELSEAIAGEYVARGPYKKALLPFTIELLDYLSPKYQLHIITNGFEEVQHLKIASSGIKNYFKHIITSEQAGFKKPEKGIFDFALKQANALPHQCIMVGDNYEIDVVGARAAGFKAVYYNPLHEEGNYGDHLEINCLSELIKVL